MFSTTVRLITLSFIAQASSEQRWFPTSTRQYYHGNAASAPTTTAIALLPRQDPAPPLTNSATCGYTSGLWFSAVTCGEQSSCIYYTEPYSAPNFGCCSSGTGCGYVSTCVDYNASNNPHTGAGVYLQDAGFFWYVHICVSLILANATWVLTSCLADSGSDVPFCSTLVLYGQEYTTSGTYSFLSYGCQSGSGTKVTAFQTTRSSSPTTSRTTSSTSSEKSTSEQSSSQSTSTEQPYAPPATSAFANPSAAATRESIAEGASGGLSQGALIGIGVGVGVAAAGALVAASFWLWRRRQQRVAVQASTSYAHYDGTRSGHASSFGAAHHGYSSDVLRKQGHEKSGLTELTSSPVRHELDGTYSR